MPLEAPAWYKCWFFGQAIGRYSCVSAPTCLTEREAGADSLRRTMYEARPQTWSEVSGSERLGNLKKWQHATDSTVSPWVKRHETGRQHALPSSTFSLWHYESWAANRGTVETAASLSVGRVVSKASSLRMVRAMQAQNEVRWSPYGLTLYRGSAPFSSFSASRFWS